MKEERSFFGVKARISSNETPKDIIQNICKNTAPDEPFYVLNAGDIYQKVKSWKLKLPRVQMFYAVKCNNNATILHMLNALGVGFDCASKTEFQKVLSMGVDPSRIVFAHPCKPMSHLRQASKLGIDLMTFDNASELHKTKAIMPSARLLIRIRCDAAKAQAPLGVKFGVLPENVGPLLALARELDLNIAGVAFHVGSGFQEAQVFERAIKHARDVFDEAISLGFKPTILDIGGGFPGHRSFLFDDAANTINAALENYFPVNSGVRIIAEPGRFVVSTAFTLATSVISKRDVHDDDEKLISTMYYINDGVYGSFNCILYDHQEVTTTSLKEAHPSMPCSVWGPTCDGLDQILSDASLPQLDVGDWLVWPDMGAYTIAAAGTFNGFPLPQVHVYVPSHTWLLFESLKGSTTGGSIQDNMNEENGYIDQGQDRPAVGFQASCNVDQFGSNLNNDHNAIISFIDLAEM